MLDQRAVVDSAGRVVLGTACEEAERAFVHVFRIAEVAGFGADDIVYVDIAFADLADVQEINVLYAELFAEGLGLVPGPGSDNNPVQQLSAKGAEALRT